MLDATDDGLVKGARGRTDGLGLTGSAGKKMAKSGKGIIGERERVFSLIIYLRCCQLLYTCYCKYYMRIQGEEGMDGWIVCVYV